MKELARSYKLRVILCHVDTEDAAEPLSQVTRAAIGNDFTLICGFSNQECARYLETLKMYVLVGFLLYFIIKHFLLKMVYIPTHQFNIILQI